MGIGCIGIIDGTIGFSLGDVKIVLHPNADNVTCTVMSKTDENELC